MIKKILLTLLVAACVAIILLSFVGIRWAMAAILSAGAIGIGYLLIYLTVYIVESIWRS